MTLIAQVERKNKRSPMTQVYTKTSLVHINKINSWAHPHRLCHDHPITIIKVSKNNYESKDIYIYNVQPRKQACLHGEWLSLG